MENQIKKCSFKDHVEINASFYCQECKKYFCNKCENFHSKLFDNHNIHNLDKDIKEIFNGFCREEKHSIELTFFCKNHNKLCCAACLSKVQNNNFGQHHDCDVCKIEEIKDEKKNKLKENINHLEELSKALNQSIKQLKEIYEKINDNIDKEKQKIQKIFTQLRNELNEREDELIKLIDEKYNNLFINEKIVKESEKLPNKIKITLENGKKADKKWNENIKLNYLINDCIMIENDIKEINIINEIIKKCISFQTEIEFKEKENENDELVKKIKSFGNIQNNNFMEKKIKEGFSNIVGFSIGANIPINYTNFYFEKYKAEDEEVIDLGDIFK